MGVRLDRLISAARTDTKITAGEVDQMIAEVKSNGTVSAAEKKTLQKTLDKYASEFDAPAKASLQAFLTGGTTPQPQQTAEQLMAQKLTEAAPDGLTGSELDQAEKAIAQKYGPKVAKETLEKALGARTGELTVDGVTWLQQQHGAMNGQITRFQNVLQTHLKDAQLLDANFDGKLDENDKIFTTGADGKINVQNVGAVLRDRVRISAAMVGASEEMAAEKHDFALIKDHTFNEQFWQPVGSGSFALKPGVKPSEAMKDINANPEKYKFECATALVIVHYKAMLELLGPKDFDAAVTNLRIGPWDYDQTLRNNWKISGDGNVDATDARKGQLRAGDYTYFRNWDVSDTGKAAGWQGENVISLGNGLYYGHPFGIATGEHIVDYLNQHRNAGSTRSASMLDMQASFDSKLLQLDKHPGE